MKDKCIITRSEEDTRQLGYKLGEYLRDHKEVVALIGDLGTGKTTFAQGLAQALGIEEKIKSPTFVLLKEYGSEFGKLVHVDAYRLEVNFEDIGLTDYFGQAIVLIEWAERLEKLLPKNAKKVYFKHVNENEREICWEGLNL